MSLENVIGLRFGLQNIKRAPLSPFFYPFRGTIWLSYRQTVIVLPLLEKEVPFSYGSETNNGLLLRGK